MLQSHSPSPSRFPFNTHSNDSKTESIVKNFYIKTAQTIIQSRQQLPQQNDPTIDHDDGKRRINRWFNMNTREYPDSLRSELKYWITRAFVSPITQPPPLIIEIYLDITNIPPGKELALQNGWKMIDLDLCSTSTTSGKKIKKNRIILENWTLSLNHPLPTQPLDLGNVYKRSILFFRTLYAFTRLLPSYQTYQRIMLDNHNSTAASSTTTDDQRFLSIGYRLTSSLNNSKEDEIGLDEGPDANTISRNLDNIVTPLGTLGLQVRYRANCDFIIHDPLAMDINSPLLSTMTTTDASVQLMDLDQHYFTPTIAKYSAGDESNEEDEEDEPDFKTISKPSILKKTTTTTTDWPPIPRKSESARVTTATTSSATPFQQRHEYSRRRPSSSSTYRRNMNNNTITSSRAPSLSHRPLSMNDGDTLFIKSSSLATEPPPPPSLSPSSSRLHVSPFKSPTLSSSSQHSSTFSLRSLRERDDEKNSSKSNITRRFSSSFDYRHTEQRYYHSAPSGGENNTSDMQNSSTSKTRSRRSLSITRKPTSSIVSFSDQDEELEEFVRSLNLRQTPGFQSRLLNEEMNDSNMNDVYGPSLDISASYYRSKKALAHFQNLRGIHDSLSQSLISSTILSPPMEEHQLQTTITTTDANNESTSSLRVTTGGGEFGANSNSSLLSSSLSRGSPMSRLYQPRAPSPLHTEPPVSPTIATGATPVRIPSNPTSPRCLHHQENDTTTVARTNVDHPSHSSSSNEYTKYPYPPFMQNSIQQHSDSNSSHEPSPINRTYQPTGNINELYQQHQPQLSQQRNTLLKYNEIRRSTRLSINTESTSSSSGGCLDKEDEDDVEDEQPISPIVHDEDDDSLVFKMSELGLNEHKQQQQH